MITARRFAMALAPALILTSVLLVQTAAARTASGKEQFNSQSARVAQYCIATYDIGKLNFGITNFGKIGIGKGKDTRIDCFTGSVPPYGLYPKGMITRYLYKGALWVGGIVGRDTLVSAGNDFNTLAREFHPITDMVRRSSLTPEAFGSDAAVSELDYVAVYTDTFVSGVSFRSFDPIDVRPHKPMGLRVEQTSYAWSYGHTDDFVMWNYRIRNIGNERIKGLYAGLYWDSDVHRSGGNVIFDPPEAGKGVTEGRDDLNGMIWDVESPFQVCGGLDTIGVAWTIDSDGDPAGDGFDVPDITGIRILGDYLTDPEVTFSYNWWVFNYNPAYDFGPQSHEKFRLMGNGTGTPYGDRNKYHLLGNGERDYDQYRTFQIGPTDLTWHEPSSRIASWYSRQADVQQLISIGPWDLEPGAAIDLPVAWVGGEGFHSLRYNYRDNLLRNYTPEVYLDNVDFSNLIRNSITAGRVYDVPGIDTNNDGYAGKFRICVFDSEFVDNNWVVTAAETTYYEGDGVPDFKAAAPPPPPDFWLTPDRNSIRVRFNGKDSEIARDVFSNELDFEGYRVYVARDNREGSFSVVAQYDRENFDKHIYTQRPGQDPRFVRVDNPLSLSEIRCLYGFGADPCADSSFDPLQYTPADPFIHPNFPDSIFYFSKHDYNQSEFGRDTPIKKIYPDQPAPTSLVNPRPDELTEDGRLKYYEYEVVIDDLLPSVPYYISVSAFDFGSPRAGLAPLESSLTLFAKSAYPNNPWDERPDSLSNIYVYPNPYRHDAYYRISGYEGRGREDRSRDRVRKVTFANLPSKCTIKIFTLDGDLIKELDHDYDPSDPNSSYHEWDMVTRNVQMIVTGMYYWVVETPDGRSHIGKLVVLL